MSTWKLTTSKCKTAKPKSSIYKLSDGEGLYLAVTPSGGKHWRVAYRVSGKAQTHCIGPWARISLEVARAKLDEFKSNLLKGEVVKVKAVSVVKAPTFKEVCTAYWLTRNDCKQNYRDGVDRCLTNHIYDHFGGTAINLVDKAQVLKALLLLDAQGKPVQLKLAKL